MNYTVKDHKTLRAIIGDGDPQLGQEYDLSNKELAERLGLSVGAAASRLFRLDQMGVVGLSYVTSPRTGKFLRRIITVRQVPPAPWNPGA
jgi:DNA-binding Lrp family transcriptional regulator